MAKSSQMVSRLKVIGKAYFKAKCSLSHTRFAVKLDAKATLAK